MAPLTAYFEFSHGGIILPRLFKIVDMKRKDSGRRTNVKLLESCWFPLVEAGNKFIRAGICNKSFFCCRWEKVNVAENAKALFLHPILYITPNTKPYKIHIRKKRLVMHLILDVYISVCTAILFQSNKARELFKFR